MRNSERSLLFETLHNMLYCQYSHHPQSDARNKRLAMAIDKLKDRGIREGNIIIVSILAAKEDLHQLSQAYPSLRVVFIACDELLNEKNISFLDWVISEIDILLLYLISNSYSLYAVFAEITSGIAKTVSKFF